MPSEPSVAQSDLHRAVEDLLAALLPDDHGSRFHLARAVLAERVSAVARQMAKSEVTAARDRDAATWDDVGGAFGLSADDAHEWFRTTPMGLPQ